MAVLKPLGTGLGQVSVTLIIAVPELAVRTLNDVQVCFGICQHIQISKARFHILGVCVDADQVAAVAVGGDRCIEDLCAGA